MEKIVIQSDCWRQLPLKMVWYRCPHVDYFCDVATLKRKLSDFNSGAETEPESPPAKRRSPAKTRGFEVFARVEGEILKQRNPGVSEMGIALGERWEKTKDEERAAYESLASEEEKEYREVLKREKALLAEETKRRWRQIRRPRTAFLLYCLLEQDKVQKSYPGMSGIEIAVLEKWEDLSTEEKERYEFMGKQDLMSDEMHYQILL